MHHSSVSQNAPHSLAPGLMLHPLAPYLMLFHFVVYVQLMMILILFLLLVLIAAAVARAVQAANDSTHYPPLPESLCYCISSHAAQGWM